MCMVWDRDIAIEEEAGSRYVCLQNVYLLLDIPFLQERVESKLNFLHFIEIQHQHYKQMQHSIEIQNNFLFIIHNRCHCL